MFDKKALKELTNKLTDFSDALTEFYKACEKEIPEAIAKEAAVAIYEDISEIFDACIAKYYSDYTPRYYSRTYSLYKVYKLQIKGSWIRWEFNPNFIPKVHRVDSIDPDYIYNWMFEKGYHGGAVGGEGHPHPGSPWYRTPPPLRNQASGKHHTTKGDNRGGYTNYGEEYYLEKPYSQWSTHMAEYSMISPSVRIKNEITNYEKNRKTIIGRTLNDTLKPAYDLVFSRYRLFNFGKKVK